MKLKEQILTFVVRYQGFTLPYRHWLTIKVTWSISYPIVCLSIYMYYWLLYGMHNCAVLYSRELCYTVVYSTVLCFTTLNCSTKLYHVLWCILKQHNSPLFIFERIITIYFKSPMIILNVNFISVQLIEGFRMHAQAQLPIGMQTLVIGSADAARTIHCR